MRIPLAQRKELFAMSRRFMQGEDEMLDPLIALAEAFRSKMQPENASEPAPVQNRMEPEVEDRIW